MYSVCSGMSFCSHKDDFEKRHEGRMEASRLLWKYGSIPASDCPFIVVSSQELQCQYGLPQKYTKVLKACIVDALCMHVCYYRAIVVGMHFT